MFTNKETTTTNNNKPATPNVQGAVNLIASGTNIEGTVQSDGDIRIDGRVKGTVISKAKVVVGSTGTVEGDIMCETADISGKVFGHAQVEDLLFMKATGYLEGDITTGKLVVESGARFSGNCRMGVKEIKPTSEKVTNQPLQKEAI